MTILKSLNLIVAPTNNRMSPKLRRRQSLIERLEEQKALAQDPQFTITKRRWIKDANGIKQPIDIQKRVKPWWRGDATGSLYLTLKSGLKTLVLDKGMTAVAVGSQDKLGAVLDALLAAAKAGELDGALEASGRAATGRKAALQQLPTSIIEAG